MRLIETSEIDVVHNSQVADRDDGVNDELKGPLSYRRIGIGSIPPVVIELGPNVVIGQNYCRGSDSKCN